MAVPMPRPRPNLGLPGAPEMQPGMAGAPMMPGAAPAPQPSFGQRFAQGLDDIRGTLLAVGPQMMAHRQDASQPLVNPQTLMLGQQMDAKRRKERKESEQERQQRAAAVQTLVDLGFAPNEKAANFWLDADPKVAEKFLSKHVENQMKGPPEPTATMRNAEFFAGLPEGDPRREFMAKPGVNIDMKGESSFVKERGKLLAEKVGEVESKVDASRGILHDYERIGGLLSDPNVYTGTGAGTINSLKRAGQTLFGLNMEGVAEAEVADKIGSAAVGKIRELVGDARMSDADREFYLNIVPRLSDSPEGIQLAVEAMREVAQSNIRREQALAEFFEQSDNAEEAWRRFRAWERSQPVWSPELMDRARQVARNRATPRGPGAGVDPEVDRLIEKWAP